MNILYAEDDIMMRKIVVRALVRLGYEVTTVDDGKEAIDAIEAEAYDLVILDLLMPRLSGYEVLDLMRHEMNMATPVLIISRNHLNETVEKARAAGANDFIAKPFEPEELVVKVTRMLAPKRK